MSRKKLRVEEGISLIPTAQNSTTKGDLSTRTSDEKLHVYLDGADRSVVTENQAQTITNKTIDVDNNTLSNVETDNLKSGTLNTSTTLASASDTQIPSALAVKTYVGTVATDLANHITATTDAHDASAISTTPISGVAGTNVQDNLASLKSQIDAGDGAIGTVATDLANHIANPTDAHDASAISITPIAGVTGTEVQTALSSLKSQIDSKVNTTGGSIITPARLDMKQDTLANLTTYALTAANGQLVFATDTKETFVIKDGQLSAVGGGSGGINYNLNPNADTNTNGYVTYANAAGVAPVDGTGNINSPTPVAVTLTRSTTSPLRGAASFLYTKPASNVQGQGYSYDFVIADEDKGKVLSASFAYQIASGTYADNDMSIWIYDITNARMIQGAPYLIKNSGIIEYFATEFQTAINSNSYRIIFHTASTSALAYTVKFDSFNISKQGKLYGSAITDPVAYTPIFSASVGTPTSVNFVWWKEGPILNVQFNFRNGASPTNSAATFTLPPGLVAAQNGRVSGFYGTQSTPASGGIYVNGNTVTFGGTNFAVPLTGTQLAASGDVAGFFSLPIQGWSSSQIMSSDADTRVVSTKVYNSSTFVTGSGTVIPFNTAVEDTNGAWDAVNYRYNVKTPGTYILRIKGQSNAITFAAAGLSHSIYYRVNGTPTDLIWNYTSGSALTVAPFIASSTKAVLKAGDYIDLAYYNNSIAVTLPAAVYFEIERISGPAQIAASESVSALYVGNPPTGTLNNSVNTVTFGTKVKDSHSAYSGGTYTVPVSGTYSISAATYQAATYVAGNQTITYIVIDGVSKYFNSKFIEASTSLVQTQVTVLSIPLLAGQLVTIGTLSNATTPTFQPSALGNYFSITRTGQY